ncbi:hypothetical protein [Paenibacillus montanisoli]|uniref:Uncharacterized protein n=1 Tax=Paenibacillus montanisoli TaxID=2081970 RepID=A0A328U7N4_9BACL|nr:hypothetical protein [Paenibacillus montanisoli]RAP76114.1 hypothetical protein DL346_11895 [Paenibacillus montanisoli]
MEFETSYINLADAPEKLKKEVIETLSEWEYELLCVRKIKSNPYGEIIQFQYTAFMYCKTFEWIQLHEVIVNNDIGETEMMDSRMYLRDVREFIKLAPNLFE